MKTIHVRQRCATCNSWDGEHPAPLGKTDTQREADCRNNSPSSEGKWPITKGDDWCKQWTEYARPPDDSGPNITSNASGEFVKFANAALANIAAQGVINIVPDLLHRIIQVLGKSRDFYIIDDKGNVYADERHAGFQISIVGIPHLVGKITPGITTVVTENHPLNQPLGEATEEQTDE